MDGLTLVDQVPVKFSGTCSREGPLTLGQINTIHWLREDVDGFFSMVEWILDIPPGASIDRITAAFGTLLGWHESLRTTYLDGPEPIQRVAGTGELQIDIYRVERTDTTPVDTGEIGRELAARLRAKPFRIAEDLAVRVAVAVAGAVPVAAAAVYSHLAADFGAMAVIGRQFAQLVRDPDGQEAPSARQPLDQAAVEASAPARRRAEAAVRHWAALLRRAPLCLYAVTGDDHHDEGPLAGWLWTHAAALALPHITARAAPSRPAVLLAAVCAVLAARTGQPECTFVSLAGNRVGWRLRDYVGTLAQDSLMALDTAAGSFDDLVRRCWTATLKANRYSQFEVYRLQETCWEIEHARGMKYHRDCVINNLVTEPMGATEGAVGTPEEPPGARASGASASSGATPADAWAALARTSINWWVPPAMETLLRFDLVQVDDSLVLGLWTGRTDRVPRTEIELLLRAVERLLVAAAAADIPLDDVASVAQVQPVVRGPDWVRVDNNWVELSAVRRLLDDAVGPPAAGVFAVGDDQPSLLAFLVAGARASTPEQAHAACLSVLSGRHTAMAPGHYVMCASAPADPADIDQWSRQPVLARGDGRCWDAIRARR
jgi:hypothetical protein